MKKIQRKFSAAFRLFKASGLSGVVGHLLGRMVQNFYTMVDKQKKRQSPRLSLDELERYLRGLGIGYQSTLLIHSSWDSLKGSELKPIDLINSLRGLVGPSGTIAMPSFTSLVAKDDISFDVDGVSSSAGWITEVFRRIPGVIRSANLSHPVCAVGPQASFLVDQHHRGGSPWDEYSPYFRIGTVRDSWIIGIGVGHGLRVATSLHCVEGILTSHRYFRKLFPKQIRYSYVSDRHGSGVSTVKVLSSVILPAKIHRFFKGLLFEDTVGGVEVYAIRARDLLEKAVEVGVRGRVMHIWPIPWPWLFSMNKLSAKEFARNTLNGSISKG